MYKYCNYLLLAVGPAYPQTINADLSALKSLLNK